MNEEPEVVVSVGAIPVGPAVISSAAAVALIVTNQVFNVGATMGFAMSGRADTAALFVGWQLIGSVFGLGSQITFAGLVRFYSLRFANAVGIGLAFVSAQAFGAFVLLREPFTPVQWIGTGLVFAGILCLTLGQ
jgi:drug/metabolite transporter (DMT)-like permease